MRRDSKNHLSTSPVNGALLAVVWTVTGCLAEPVDLDGSEGDIGVEHQALIECPEGYTPDSRMRRGTCQYGLRSVDARYARFTEYRGQEGRYQCMAYCSAEFVLRSVQPSCEPPAVDPSNRDQVCNDVITETDFWVVFDIVDAEYEDRAVRLCRASLEQHQETVDARCAARVNEVLSEQGSTREGIYEVRRSFACCIPFADDGDSAGSPEFPDGKQSGSEESW